MPYWGTVGSHLSSTTSRALCLPKHRPLQSRDIQESKKIHRIPETNKDSQIPFKIWEPSITSSLNNALQTHADAVQQRLHHSHAVRLRAHEPCKSEVGIQSQGRLTIITKNWEAPSWSAPGPYASPRPLHPKFQLWVGFGCITQLKPPTLCTLTDNRRHHSWICRPPGVQT